MSKVRDIKPVQTVEDVTTEVQNEAPPPSVSLAPPVTTAPTEKMSDVDRMQLELARSKRQTALAEAKTALAQNENAELNYKYVVLQLYMKYGLTQADAISENGDIVRGGALGPQGAPRLPVSS
jgi:hypothetical protein